MALIFVGLRDFIVNFYQFVYLLVLGSTLNHDLFITIINLQKLCYSYSNLVFIHVLLQLQMRSQHVIINNKIKSMHTNSYFAKHKLAQSKQSRLKSSKNPNLNPNTIPSSNPAPYSQSNDHRQLNDSHIQEQLIEKKRSQNLHSLKNAQNAGMFFQQLPYSQLKTEQQKIYEQYKKVREKYQQQLKHLHTQKQRIQKQSSQEIKKIKQAENNLQNKKKQLKIVKARYEQMKTNYEKEQIEEVCQDKIGKLEKQLEDIVEINRKKIQQLQKEEEEAKEQNKKLQEKYQQLQIQYKKTLEFDQTHFEGEKKKLQQEQKRLKQQLNNLENQSDRLRKQIQKIQQMKPVGSDVHKKYLDLLQKIFISQELAKAQKIMAMKQEQKKQNIEYTRRKQMLKQKQKQIQQREARVAEKNRQVDKLTIEIREKSTLLLTKYQQDVEKHKR